MVRITKRGVKCLEDKVQQAYRIQIRDYHKKFHEFILKKCYDKIKNIIWIQNHNLVIAILIENLNLPKELIKHIQQYARETRTIR